MYDDDSNDSDYSYEEEDETVGGVNEDDPDLIDDAGHKDINIDDCDWSSFESMASEDEGTTSIKHKVSTKVKKTVVKCKKFSEIDVFTPQFELGTLFNDKAIFRDAVHSHALNTWRPLKIYPNDRKRMHVKCKWQRRDKKCPFKLHAYKGANEDSYKVIEYFPKHICPEDHSITNIKSTWLAKKYLSTFKLIQGV